MIRAFLADLHLLVIEKLKLSRREAHRRAVLEAEVMEALSYQRHRIQALERRIAALETKP